MSTEQTWPGNFDFRERVLFAMSETPQPWTTPDIERALSSAAQGLGEADGLLGKLKEEVQRLKDALLEIATGHVVGGSPAEDLQMCRRIAMVALALEEPPSTHEGGK